MIRQLLVVTMTILLNTVSVSLGQTLGNTDSLEQEYDRMVIRNYTPLIERRKEERRAIQRRGYAEVAMDAKRWDGLSALISIVKAKLLIEFTLPHNTLWIVAPIPGMAMSGIPIPEDWTYPADPWKRQ